MSMECLEKHYLIQKSMYKKNPPTTEASGFWCKAYEWFFSSNHRQWKRLYLAGFMGKLPSHTRLEHSQCSEISKGSCSQTPSHPWPAPQRVVMLCRMFAFLAQAPSFLGLSSFFKGLWWDLLIGKKGNSENTFPLSAQSSVFSTPVPSPSPSSQLQGPIKLLSF